MLKDNFFTIEERTQTEKGWEYCIAINASHAIYQAHFPQNPVTPGVCIVQMMKEIAEDCCSKSFFICSLKNVKFLQILNPIENPEVLVKFNSQVNEAGRYAVSAVICKDQLVFSKLNLQLAEISEGGND